VALLIPKLSCLPAPCCLPPCSVPWNCPATRTRKQRLAKHCLRIRVVRGRVPSHLCCWIHWLAFNDLFERGLASCVRELHTYINNRYDSAVAFVV